MKKISLEQLKSLPATKIFRYGVIDNEKLDDPNFPTNVHVRFVAKKGNGHNDWAIYLSYAVSKNDDIAKYGIKVTRPLEIQMLCPCTKQAYEKYRF